MRPATPDFTLEQIDAVMREHDIGEDGYRYTNDLGKVVGLDVQKASPRYRAAFLDQVNIVARLLRYADRAPHTEHTIHELKVEIEFVTRCYVSNGAVLTAVLLLGIHAKQTEERTSGAYVAISRKHKFLSPRASAAQL